MNFERILEIIRTYVLNAGVPDLTIRDIALPNTVFSSEGKTLWIELTGSLGRSGLVTESETFLPAEINIVVGVPLQSGTKKANCIATLIASNFSVADNTKRNGFWADGARVYVVGVNILPGVLDNSGYRINVRISLDIYKEC